MGGYTIGQKFADILQGGWIKLVDKRSKRGTGKNTIEDWTTNYKEKKLEERERKMERSKSTKEYNRWKTNERAKYLE